MKHKMNNKLIQNKDKMIKIINLNIFFIKSHKILNYFIIRFLFIIIFISYTHFICICKI